MAQLEDILAHERSEAEARKKGIEKLCGFIEKAHILGGGEGVADLFGRVSFGEFESFLGRLNGILVAIPPAQRQAFKHDTGVQSFGPTSAALELMPPPQERRRELLRSVFDRLQDLARRKVPGFTEIAPLAIFNAIIYLHPFRDGNGRTARTAYYLLRKQEVQSAPNADELSRALVVRPAAITEYHWFVNTSALFDLLEKSGWEAPAEDMQHVPLYDSDNPTRGFDADHLRFLAAWRALSPMERTRFVRRSPAGDVIVESTLSSEQRVVINEELKKVRDEFITDILLESTKEKPFPSQFREQLESAILKADI